MNYDSAQLVDANATVDEDELFYEPFHVVYGVTVLLKNSGLRCFPNDCRPRYFGLLLLYFDYFGFMDFIFVTVSYRTLFQVLQVRFRDEMKDAKK